MTEHLLLQLAALVCLGTGAQWLAWRIRVPSILLLLLFGVWAGPVAGLIVPDELLGELLFPVVSLAVAIILFEGGLSLRRSEIRQTGTVVRNLITIGTVVTWGGAALAGRFILDMDPRMALLFGAILVVSGPTVVLPLLRHVRPTGSVGAVLKWEAILIDPIGAMLAVLVFEAIAATGEQAVATGIALTVLRTAVAGGAMGLIGTLTIVLMLRRYWVPDYLENPLVLMVVLAAFVASNHFQTESGLLAVTVLGIGLANQPWVPIKHVIEFKENLRVLLISTLFILLAARLDLNALTNVGVPGLVFLAILIFVVRPAAVWLSSIRTGMAWRERLFLAWVAPRGIVAAAVASVFALRLEQTATLSSEAPTLVPLTFLVILGTVAVYGLTAGPFARVLNVAQPHAQGLLIIGAHSLARAVAEVLKKEGFRVLLVDTNWHHVAAARLAGLPVNYTNILSEYALYEMDLTGIGRLAALTPNDEVNSLAIMHFSDVFDRSELFQLPVEKRGPTRKEVSHDLRGRALFRAGTTYYHLMDRLNKGALVKKTTLREEFDYEAFQKRYAEKAVPLFVVTDEKKLVVWTAKDGPMPRKGDAIIALVDPMDEPESSS